MRCMRLGTSHRSPALHARRYSNSIAQRLDAKSDRRPLRALETKNENEGGGCCKFVTRFSALAQYYYVNPYSGPNSFYYQYYWDSPAAEDDLADAKARREKARE